MEIFVTLGIILLACLFYAMSYITPKTDVLMYGLSAIFFLVGGVVGMMGYTEVNLGEKDISVEEIQTSNTTASYTIDYQVKREKVPFLNFLPVIFVLFSIYQFSVIATQFRKDG